MQRILSLVPAVELEVDPCPRNGCLDAAAISGCDSLYKSPTTQKQSHRQSNYVHVYYTGSQMWVNLFFT